MPNHPGGYENIKAYFGKNMEEPFAEEGHSKFALKILTQK